MDTSLITVFTPTYNRVNTLPKLFESLCKQTCFDFEWLIVDDGSIDGTKELIQEYIKSNPPFRINYVWQINAGKSMAINHALSIIKSTYIYFMDSDDYLPSKAIEQILPYLKEVQYDQKFSGVAGLRTHADGTPIGSLIPNPILDADYLSFRYKYKAKGDYADIVKTDVMKENMFPVYQGEKFCTEAVVFNRMAKKYKCRYINCPLRITEYLPNGLTDTYAKIMKESPNYSMLYYKELLYSKISFKDKLFALISYWNMYKIIPLNKIQEEVRPTFIMKIIAMIVLQIRGLYRLIKMIR